MTTRIGLLGSDADCELLQRLLAGEGEVWRLSPGETEQAVRDGTLSLLILGPAGEWWAGFDGLATLPVEAARHPVMVLALVPRGDSAALELAFDRGVADCASYPIDDGEVRARIRALLRRKETADRLRAEAVEARRLAHVDPVTGLWNRHYLDMELAAAMARAQASLTPLTLLMIDIDGFKPINDRHGHAAGDRVLHAVGTRLASSVRSVDTVARFGGDELVVIMPGVPLAAARGVAERLRALIADTPVLMPLPTTVSIGLAEMIDGDEALALLARADTALYTAKMAGRNRVEEAA